METKLKVAGSFVVIPINKIRLRCREAGDRNAPLIILVHGWPESWYSWRHQILPLANLGYKVVAPDVRGYGGSDAPEELQAYDMRNLIDDLLGIIDHYGNKQAILIGHDWGAPIVWNTAALYPEKVKGVAGLSVPYSPRGKMSSIDLWKSIYKDRFFYQLYFQEPGKAEKELDENIKLSLLKIYYAGSGDAPSDIFRSQKGPNSKMLTDLPYPESFPIWLSEADLDYYTNQFEGRGFRPSLNRYRNQERDWKDLPLLANARIQVPSCFIGGEKDKVLKFVPNVDLVQNMRRWMDNLQICEIIENIGHWVQQENPKKVNELLIKFVKNL